MTRLGKARGLTKKQRAIAWEKAAKAAGTDAIYKLTFGYGDVYSGLYPICEREVMRQVFDS